MQSDAADQKTLADLEHVMHLNAGDNLPRYLKLGIAFFLKCVDAFVAALHSKSIYKLTAEIRLFLRENSSSLYGGLVNSTCDLQRPLFRDALPPLVALLEILHRKLTYGDRAITTIIHNVMIETLRAMRVGNVQPEALPTWHNISLLYQGKDRNDPEFKKMIDEQIDSNVYRLLHRLYSKTYATVNYSGTGKSSNDPITFSEEDDGASRCGVENSAEWQCEFCGGHRVRQHALQLHTRRM